MMSIFLVVAMMASAQAFVSPMAKPFLSQSQQIGTLNTQPYIKSTRGHTLLFMGWGPEPVWASATVTENEKACKSGSCVSIHVDVPADTAAEYATPGQYVQVRLNEETQPLFLAIASAPDKENASFEFLIKKTDNNDWITAAESGLTVEVSQVLGNGFPMDENLEGHKYDFPTQNVLLFGAGSGIAPLKAAIESGQLNVNKALKGGRTARLYYGVQNADELCFVDSFGKWELNGVQVVPVMSQPPSDWEGRTGYVQAALEEDGVAIPRNSGALMCGMKGMAEAVKDVLIKAGMFEGRILTNF